MSDPAIDWEPLHKYAKDTVTCQCGARFMSHIKGIIHEGRFTVFTETPCPKCDSNRDPRRVEGPVETWSIPAKR